jgi:hypothetical protein
LPGAEAKVVTSGEVVTKEPVLLANGLNATIIDVLIMIILSTMVATLVMMDLFFYRILFSTCYLITPCRSSKWVLVDLEGGLLLV